MPTTTELPAGYVTHAPGLGYFVHSRTSPGVWYLVRGDECTCRAGQDGNRCWHLRTVAEFVRRINEDKARPIAPPHVSALVD